MKRTKLLASLMMCVMCLGFLVVGVWAAVSTVNFNLNAGLKYYPEGIYVELSGQVYRGSSEETLEALTYDPRFTLSPTTNYDNSTGEPSGNFPMESWEIGSIPFIPTEKFIKIEVNVKNNSNYPITGTPLITFDNGNDISTISNIITTENTLGIGYIEVDETETYELLLEISDNVEINNNLNVSFDFEEISANYNNFNIYPSGSNWYISSLKSDYTEDVPGILIVPGTEENNDNSLYITDNSSSSNSPFRNLKTSTKRIVLQNGLTSIGSYAFYNCSILERINIPSTITSIRSYAFFGCSNLQSSINIPEGVTAIERSTFSDCSNLTMITIPSSVESIGIEAFARCSKLENLVLPEDLTSLGSGAFTSCVNLKNINIPLGITAIKMYTFTSCTLLDNIIIPANVVSIQSSAFSSCRNLSKLVLSNGIETIEGNSFWGCTSLENLTIPSSVTNISASAFWSCANLQITVDQGNTNYSSSNGSLYNKDKTTLIRASGKMATFEILDTVTSIGDYAFYGCSYLKNIIIPSTVTSIGQQAFYNCTNLTNLTINTKSDYVWQKASNNTFTQNLTTVDVSDPAQNAVWFKSTSSYYNYFWRQILDA